MIIKYKKEKIKVKVKECKGINKFIGLMFKKNSTPLLFNVKRGTFHSLFCKPFLLIWLDEKNKVVDYEIVKNIRFNIKTEKKFSRILEIPLTKKYKKIISLFDKKKSLNTNFSK